MSSHSTLEWLREQQKRYVAKTPEQIRAECLAMDFEQLRKRAGPPPVVFGCAYYDPSFCEGSSGGAEQLNFDSSLQDFKRGLCPPPYPLYDASHPDARDSGVIAYDAWFAQWGKLLRNKWTEKSAPTSAKKPIVTAAPSKKEPSMISVVTPPKPVALEVVVELPPVVQPAPAAFDDVCVKFQQMWREDPLIDALNRGDINWGDLDLYDESVAQWEKYHDAIIEKKLSEPEPEIIPEPQEVPAKKEEIVVPAFTPGIKTLMARNLPRDITVEQLRAVFEKYGPLKDVYIPRNMDKNSIYFGTIKGFAKVEFLKSEHSAKAFQEEFGRITFGSNKVSLEFAKEDRAPQQSKTQRK